MRCEGCDARLGVGAADISVILQAGMLSIQCPNCKFITPLYCKGTKVETLREHEQRVNSWGRGSKDIIEKRISKLKEIRS